MLIPPFFLDAVVAIGFANAAGQTQWVATGFLFGRFIEKVDEKTNQYQISLITNKHVLAGHDEARVRFNPDADEPAKEFGMPLVSTTGAQIVYPHPDDEIDVAVVPINAEMLRQNGIRFNFFQSDKHILERSAAREKGVAEGDGIFVLGFPLGLVGERRSVVLVRQGVLARVTDCLEGHANDFLIDATVFPGNSGGPIILKPEITAIKGTQSTNAAYLLGIVAAYVPYTDVAISAQTHQPRVIFQENSGLAKVFPVDTILEALEKVPKPTDAKAPPEAGGAVEQSRETDGH